MTGQPRVGCGCAVVVDGRLLLVKRLGAALQAQFEALVDPRYARAA